MDAISFDITTLAKEAGVSVGSGASGVAGRGGRVGGPGTRVWMGANVCERVAELAGELNMTRILLVTDPGVRAAGHADRVAKTFDTSGLTVTIFDQVQANPTTATVERGTEVAREAGIDGLIAVGGGSAMDAAKGVNFLATQGGVMHDFKGRDTARGPMLPMIALPTTAGTGSEVQSFALISDAQTHEKMACGDLRAAPRYSLLDPTLAVTAPRGVQFLAGIDAIVHAVECAVTTARNPLSLWLARQAFAEGHAALATLLGEDDSSDLTVMARMQRAACLAGFAIENSMLGAAHAAANPLTARHDLPHGHAVGLMLPMLVRVNFTAAPQLTGPLYRELAMAGTLVTAQATDAEAVQALIARLEFLFSLGGLPARLGELGIGPDDLPQLAADAARQWTGQFNPVPMRAEDFVQLYAALL